MGRLILVPVLLTGLMIAGCEMFQGAHGTPFERANKYYAQGNEYYAKAWYNHAYRAYKFSADLGHANAEFAIGYMHETGTISRGAFGIFGSDRDYGEAGKWYRKAAARGSVGAQSNLGHMYANGLGVARDDAVAARWYYKAAIQGLGEAQYNLANKYHEGTGVPRDNVQAHTWASLAAANSAGTTQGYAARLRDLIASEMTPAELSNAQQLARDWSGGIAGAAPVLPKGPPNIVARESVNPDTASRLAELKKLHDQGLITDRDYAEKRKEILKGL